MGVFETYTGTFRQVYWNGTNFLNKLPFVFKYISAFSHLAIHKEPFFWTLQKSNQYFVFKTTYLFSKVIVPKHKNWRWMRQRAFQDRPLQLCLSWISVSCVPAPKLRWAFWAGANIFQYRVTCYWLHCPTDRTLQAGRGECNMDLGGSMYPVWFFQLLNAMANWSLQVALSSQEALREHRSVPLIWAWNNA